MANVIDELVTILGLDLAPGVGPAAQKFSTMLDGISRQVKWVSAGLVAAAGSIAYFAERMNQTSFQMLKMSQLSGINSSDMQELGFAAEQAGGSFDALMQDLSSLSKSMSSPMPGEFNQGLFMLGISAFNASGKLKAADDVMMEIASKFQGHSQVWKTQMGQRIGLSDDTIMLLSMGVDKIQEFRQQAKDLPIIVSPEQLENAKQFTLQLTLGRRMLSYFGQMAAGVAGPAMKALIGDFSSWLKVNKELIQTGLKNFIEGTVDGFRRFGQILSRVKESAENTVPWIAKLVAALTDADTIAHLVYTTLAVLTGVMLYFAAPWVATGLAIAGAALALDDFITYAQGGDSAIGSLIESVEGMWSSFSEKFPKTAKILGSVGTVIKNSIIIIIDDLVAGFKLAVEGLTMLGDKFSWIVGLFGAFTGMQSFVDFFTKAAEGSDVAVEVNRRGLETFVENAQIYNKVQDAAPAPRPASGKEGASITINQNITGGNAPAVAAESAVKLNQSLQSIFPGGLYQVAN